MQIQQQMTKWNIKACIDMIKKDKKRLNPSNYNGFIAQVIKNKR
jgi:hypothetical protein